MNNLRQVIDKVTSGDAPVWVLAGAGVILFLVALRTAKGFLKFVFAVLALAAVAGAVWWHFHNQGKI
jgi:hypothetical protein